MAQKPAAPRRRRLGCLIGIVSLLVLIITGALLSFHVIFFPLQECQPGPGGYCPTSGNPLGLSTTVLSVLFVLSAIGTVGSAIQQIWNAGKAVARLFQHGK